MMQQWALDRTSESPESTGRPSGFSRETKFSKADEFLESQRYRAGWRDSTHGRLSNEIGATHRPPRTPSHDKEDEEEEGRRSAPQRLSRHIPQRVGIDMSVSSFNLTSSSPCLPQGGAPSPRTHSGAGGVHLRAAANRHAITGGYNGAAAMSGTHGHAIAATGTTITAAATTLTPSSSAYTSFSDSIVSDDSSYMTSLYNDVLADHLIGTNRTCTTGAGGRLNGRDTMSYSTLADTPHSNGGRCVPSVTVSDANVGAERYGSDEPERNRRAAADSASRRGLGGEILRFANTKDTEAALRSPCTASTTQSASLRFTTLTTKGPSRTPAITVLASAMPNARSRTIYTSGGGTGRTAGVTRVFHTTPNRVLDAPELPVNATQLLDWGANNFIMIGLGQSLYMWNGDTAQASKVVTLDAEMRIRCVQWLQKCTCVAMSVQDGLTAIYDCGRSDFLRTVRLPSGLEATGITVKGPIMAVASGGPQGTTCVYDLRAKDALVATFEGHSGAVTSLHYNAAEPYYLATGGSDGAVRVWDARRASVPKYAFDGVHHGSVNVVRWDPQKRSRLFTGGEDGVLCLLDTHAPKRTIEMDNTVDEESVATGCSQEHLAQYVTRAVNTQFPISGLVCHGPNGELVTSHKKNGQLQLRKTANLHLLSTFTAPFCTASLSCPTLAPDKETICAAQEDERLKFWRVFDNSVARGAERNGIDRVEDGWAPQQRNPNSFLEEPLR